MSVLTLADAKQHLNITSSTYDTELQTVIDTAEAAITSRIGPIAQTSGQVWAADGARPTITLPDAPIVSVESVSENGITLTANVDYIVDLAAGRITRGPAQSFITLVWLPGTQNIVVNYTAGYSSVPRDLYFAIKEQVRHLWRPQRGPGARPGATDADEAIGPPLMAGMLAPGVEEMLTPYIGLGFA